MKLLDLRKTAIREQAKIHFRLRNGMECIISEHGVAQVPGLHAKPEFNLEEELDVAAEFLLEPKPPKAPRKLRREELESMAAAAPVAAAAHDHDDE
jgi:hypothetical protein